jgi:hypothetical protein
MSMPLIACSAAPRRPWYQLARYMRSQASWRSHALRPATASRRPAQKSGMWAGASTSAFTIQGCESTSAYPAAPSSLVTRITQLWRGPETSPPGVGCPYSTPPSRIRTSTSAIRVSVMR